MPGLVEGTRTMFFIDKTDVPSNRWRDVTYGRVVVDYIPVCHQTCTSAKKMNRQHENSRTISLKDCALSIQIYHYNFGIYSYIKNLMRKSKINRNLSDHEHLFGIFNFNCTPFAPPKTKNTGP